MSTALLSIAGTLLGVLIGSILTRRHDIDRERRNKISDLYSKFLQANAKLAFEGTSLDNPEWMIEYQIVCEEMCICASKDILSKVAQMHRELKNNSKYLDSLEGKEAYIDIIQTMRLETNSSAKEINFMTLTDVIWQ